MKSITTLLLAVSPLVVAIAQAPSGSSFGLLIGTYTNKDKDSGIQLYFFDTETGDFTYKSKATGITNPSYLAISKDKKNLYSVSEAGPGNSMINAFALDVQQGTVTFTNNAPAGGNGPCYVSVLDNKKFVFGGNYGGGSLTAIPVKADGSLGAETQTIQHEGSSVNKSRQDKPHVHSTVISPDGKYLMVPDLGTDRVYVYKIDPSKPQPLSPADPPYASSKPGTGPRHLTFHPNGKFAYLILELEASVMGFSLKDGKLEPLQVISMVAPGFTGPVSGADIHVSPDGKFLYGSNRGDANEIAIFSVDRKGMLTSVGRQSTGGRTPRNFAIDPTGNFLLAANQNTDDVVIFRRDKKTGLLTPTGKKIPVSTPVCLKFVAMN